MCVHTHGSRAHLLVCVHDMHVCTHTRTPTGRVHTCWFVGVRACMHACVALSTTTFALDVDMCVFVCVCVLRRRPLVPGVHAAELGHAHGAGHDHQHVCHPGRPLLPVARRRESQRQEADPPAAVRAGAAGPGGPPLGDDHPRRPHRVPVAAGCGGAGRQPRGCGQPRAVRPRRGGAGRTAAAGASRRCFTRACSGTWTWRSGS